MMTRLDRYVGRYFLSSWVMSLVFFVGLYGVYDFFAHVDDLFDEISGAGAGVVSVIRLYMYQLPGILLRVAPFVMVMSALVTVLRLQRHNEMMAMIMTGRSARRALRTVFTLTGAFVVLIVWVQEGVAPRVAFERDLLRNELLEHGKDLIFEEIAMKDAEGRLFVARNFNASRGVIERLNASFTDELGRNVNISGDEAAWDASAGGWKLVGGRREIRNTAGSTPIVEELGFVSTDIRPDDLIADSREPFDLPYLDVLRLSRLYPQSRRYHLLRHYHVTFPLSVMLLVLLAMPFVLSHDAQRRLRGLGISIMLCVGFFVVDATVRDLGSRGFLQPVLAAWLPVIVAGSLVVVLYDALDP